MKSRKERRNPTRLVVLSILTCPGGQCKRVSGKYFLVQVRYVRVSVLREVCRRVVFCFQFVWLYIPARIPMGDGASKSPLSPLKRPRGGSNDVQRFDETLSFVAGNSNTGTLSAIDSDVYSWLLMNSDIFPSSQSHAANSGLAEDTQLLDAVLDDDEIVKEEEGALDKLHDVAGATSGSGLHRVDSLEGLSTEEKRLRRLEKNREIARNCRKRKREKIGRMEAEMQDLREENKLLKSRLEKAASGNSAAGGPGPSGWSGSGIPGTSLDPSVVSSLDRKKSIREIRELIGTGDEAALVKRLSEYRDTFSDYGKHRKQAVLDHLASLKKLLLPTEMTKMTMWSLQQEDEFYDEEKNHAVFGGSIWTVLCETMNFTPEQKKKLIGMRHSIRGQRKNLSHCVSILHELQSAVSDNIVALESNMTTVLNAISPEQQAKFLLWVESNQTCMLMLNNLWSQQNAGMVLDPSIARGGSGTKKARQDTPNPQPAI